MFIHSAIGDCQRLIYEKQFESIRIICEIAENTLMAAPVITWESLEDVVSNNIANKTV